MSATTAKTMKVVMLDAGRLVPHPKNREFPQEGAEWEEFVESIRFRGVQLPILARPMGKDWQIVAGHRRTAAAKEAGMLEVPVIVRKMSDKEAMEIVFIDNLHVVDLNPVDEAKGVEGLLEVGMAPEQVAERICRDIRWVKTRQGILELGEEVMLAMRRPKEDAGHLGVRTVEEILKVPVELREQAIQLVLHSDFEEGVLSPRQAAEVLQERLVKPRAAEVEWEAAREKLAKKGWRPRLAKLCLKGTKGDLLVVSVPFGDTERIARGGIGAEVKVAVAECTPEAPQFLLWLHLAVRHGQPVRVVHDPAGGQDKSFALVDQRPLIEAEEAAAEQLILAERELVKCQAIAEAGATEVEREDARRRILELKELMPKLVPWLVTKARGRVSREAGEQSRTGEAGQRVAHPAAEGVSREELLEASESALKCECCGEGCEERMACDECKKMCCSGCSITQDYGDDCYRCATCDEVTAGRPDRASEPEDVPALLKKNQEKLLPEHAYVEPAGFDSASFGNLSYRVFLERVESLIRDAGLKRSTAATRARGEWCEAYFGRIQPDVPEFFVKFAVAFHDRLGLEEHVLEDLRDVLGAVLIGGQRPVPAWLDLETDAAYDVLWGTGPGAIGFDGVPADAAPGDTFVSVDWGPVHELLEWTYAQEEMAGDDRAPEPEGGLPEWCKDLTPQHVRDVVFWFRSHAEEEEGD